MPAQSSGSKEEKPPGVIVAERPDQTNSPELVPRGYLQWETGFVREQDRIGDTKNVNYLYNTSLVRYGLSTEFELRLLIEYAGRKNETLTGSSSAQGFNPIVVGTKIFVCDQQSVVPQTSLNLSLRLPHFGATEFRSRYLAPAMFLFFENEISERVSLGYNLGLQWDGVLPHATAVLTASLGLSVSSRVNIFLEGYMYAIEKAVPDQRADWGLSYLASNTFVVDVSAGLRLNQNAPDSFVSFGFSWRLPD